MSIAKRNHSKWLHIRLTEDEYNQIFKKYQASTCRKISEYTRRVLLDKSITMNVRNQSLDEFMTEMIKLRNDLNNVGNNFNQAVKRLHTLQKITEFKSWFLLYEMTRKTVMQNIESIRQKISQISDQWLQ